MSEYWMEQRLRASAFSGGALVDVGEAMKRLAEVKDSLDIDVQQNFIDPLQALCDKDLREIQVLLFPQISVNRRLKPDSNV